MPILPKKLYSVVWELTLRCNAHCQHCGSSAGKTRENELTLEENLRICDQLIELKCERINLMGGELFLNPDWKTIAEYLSKNGVLVSIITNGILLNKENLDFLKKINTETIGISIDGGLPKTHDDVRQVPGLFEKIFNNIKGDVKLESVYFGYEKGQTVLKNINLEVKHGEVVAVVRASDVRERHGDLAGLRIEGVGAERAAGDAVHNPSAL